MNNQTYETREEATRSLVEDQERAMEKLCPVFKRGCYGDNCLSFERGDAYRLKSDVETWKIRKCYCMSPLVDGKIEYEQI